MNYCLSAFLSTIFFLFLPFILLAQTHEKELQPGYYVVVAAYAESKEALARIYQDKLNTEGHEASYGYNSKKGLFFVYLSFHTSLKEGLNSMTTTRKKGVFTDAWVRVVSGTIQIPEAKEKVTQVNQPGDSEKINTPIATAVDSAAVEENNEEKVEEIVQYDPMTLGNTEVFLSLFNGTNNRIIDGDIEVIDAERSRPIDKVRGNEYMILPDPKSKSGQLTFIADVFGYRKVQHEINYKRPLADTTKAYVDLIGTTFVINFDMVRYRTGDIATLYQVYFYNDAAIMLPESRYQLGELLSLMKENAHYRIRLHGHTNGNYQGKIISAGPGQDFFSLTNEARTTIGSAKQLSQLRAEVIKDYLIREGIEADRVEIKAWGGKRPIYDRRGVNAKKNVRVEVEILQD
ncbi:MAG TPA: OmpA family protein [Cyclobacteriaceae bacterium]|nr:OmpA family protein [Cyclobacteriaceae bacterium]